MERVVYQQMAELDDRHWWYRARRKIIADLIHREAHLPPDAQILEIGCGTGHNLAMLSGFGHVEGLELDAEARAISERRLGRSIMSSPLPELAGVPDRHYDLIGAFDVIEHIDDDRAALEFDRDEAEARGMLHHDGAGTPVDVVGARCR